MSNISKKTYVWVLLAMAVIMGSGLLYSANARAGEIVKTEKNGDEGTFPWQNEFTTTALNYESDTQKETEKTTQKVTTQQKEETNVTTVVISDEKCVNATIKRTKIKKIKKKASNKISIKLKVLKSVNGYQIKISTSKKFKAKATRTLNINKINFTIKNIKNKKILFFCVIFADLIRIVYVMKVCEAEIRHFILRISVRIKGSEQNVIYLCTDRQRIIKISANF